MDVTVHRPPSLQGTLTVPPDKAICHRAVLIAALAKGATKICPWPSADDCQRTLQLIRQLGVTVTASPDVVRIEGCGALQAPTQELFCGESGTTFRLAAGLLAGQPFSATLAAGPSLSQRPMRRIVEPLSRMGATFGGSEAPAGGSEVYPPLTIHGRRPLTAIRYEMPVASAQVKSAVLLAGLFADGPTAVVEREPTRDHTERTLRHFGLNVRVSGREVSLEPGLLTSPGTLVIPGDFSSAAFFVVAAACVPGSRMTITDVSLNPTRVALLGLLKRMGAGVTWAVSDERWEPRGTITVEAHPLDGITLEATEAAGVIDELPILMVAAASAQGLTRLSGIGELRVKETDRIRSMVNGLRQMGLRIREGAPDTVEIEGTRLRGADVDSAGDHRTAMSLAVAGLMADGVTTVRGAECVAKSFPDFFDRLGRLTSSPTVKTVDKA